MGVKVKVPNKKKLVSLRKMGDTIELFKSTINRLSEKIVDRSTELKVVQLLMLAEEHLMLDGPPGVAKSMLADLVFAEISGSSLFKKRLMKGTQPEELFGPMNINRLRHESVVEFNTSNMMPESHFVYLDEVYRASDMLLDSMLGVVNEREFINGPKVVRCPLIMCIGTTNFVTDNEELEAFHDRWLVTVKTVSLRNSASRMKMYNSFINRLLNEQSVTIGEPLSIHELHAMIIRRRAVELPEIVLTIYDELVTALEKACKASSIKLNVSDRRRCQILKLVQANALLDRRDSATIDDLIVCQYGLGAVNDDTFTGVFVNVYQNIVSAYQAEMADQVDLERINKAVLKNFDRYDASLNNNTLLEMYNWLGSARAAFADKRNKWATSKLQRKADEIEAKLVTLKSEIEKNLEERNIALANLNLLP